VLGHRTAHVELTQRGSARQHDRPYYVTQPILRDQRVILESVACDVAGFQLHADPKQSRLTLHSDHCLAKAVCLDIH
jgi:hypothetical protein